MSWHPRVAILITTALSVCTPFSAVRGQIADDDLHRAPAKVIDDALTRIFDGGGGAPPGDERSVKLSTAEHAAANHAGQMFNTEGYAPGFGYPEAQLYDTRFPAQAQRFRERLQGVVAKYGAREQLSATESEEINQALAPFMRGLAVSAELATGKLTIPPRTKCRLMLTPYCMDKSLPAPRAGEKMQLVPVETLLPGNLAALYRRVVEYPGTDAATRSQIQGLIWTLRQIAQDPKGKKPVTISERQRAILNSVQPDGFAHFQALRQPLGRSSLPADLEKLVRDEVAEAVGSDGAVGNYATKMLDDGTMVDAVNQQLEHLRSMPVNEPIPNDNSHYTKLGPGVYARTVYGSVDVQIANNSEQDYVFQPSAFAAQSERKVQRMGLHIGPDLGYRPTERINVDIPITEASPSEASIDRIIFVNGVQTCFAEAACIAEALHSKLKVPVTLVYNEELSKWLDYLTAARDDLRESLNLDTPTAHRYEWSDTAVSTPAVRLDSFETFRSLNTATEALVRRIIDAPEDEKRIGLLGHSEGTLIINHALKALKLARTGDIVLRPSQSGSPMSTNEIPNRGPGSLHVILAGGEHPAKETKEVADTAIELRHERDPVVRTWLNMGDALRRAAAAAGVQGPPFAMYALTGLLSNPSDAAGERPARQPARKEYHDFMRVYYPAVQLETFEQKESPPPLRGEPAAGSVCDGKGASNN